MNKYDEVFNELYQKLKEEKRNSALLDGDLARQYDYANTVNKKYELSQKKFNNLDKILFVLDNYAELTKKYRFIGTAIAIFTAVVTSFCSITGYSAIHESLPVYLPYIFGLLGTCLGITLGGGYYYSNRGAGEYVETYNANKNKEDSLKEEFTQEKAKLTVLARDKEAIQEYIKELQDKLKLTQKEIKSLELNITYITSKKMNALTNLACEPLIEAKLDSVFSQDIEIARVLKK